MEHSLDEEFPVNIDIVSIEAQLPTPSVFVDSVQKLLKSMIISPNSSFLDCLERNRFMVFDNNL